MAMALAKELTPMSLPEIGQNFGGRDHTTVLHACRQIASLRESTLRFSTISRSCCKYCAVDGEESERSKVNERAPVKPC